MSMKKYLLINSNEEIKLRTDSLADIQNYLIECFVSSLKEYLDVGLNYEDLYKIYDLVNNINSLELLNCSNLDIDEINYSFKQLLKYTGILKYKLAL